jgi:hypothetical protein
MSFDIETHRIPSKLLTIQADRDFKAHFAWCPPIVRTRNTPRERPLEGAQTTRLPRNTPPSAP